jgi:CDP-4-dehydro-6-deoxyglucose reductase, E3
MAAKPRDCSARVAAVRALAPQVLEAELRMEDPPALEFAAGQWVSVPFGPKTVRAYSIASTPQSPSAITLCADVVPGGIGSEWFRRLAPGDPVSFKGPLGGFVFSRADPRRPLFVAEEIGIVPIRSILTELYATGFGRPTTLVYSAPDPTRLVYHAELVSLARRYPAFAYRPVVERAPDDWRGARGGLVETVEHAAPSTDGLVVYVAGGESAIHRVRDLMTSRGLDRKAVRWEKFW